MAGNDDEPKLKVGDWSRKGAIVRRCEATHRRGSAFASVLRVRWCLVRKVFDT